MGRDDPFVANLASAASENFGGEAVIIHFDRGTYFSLGGSAPALWTMMQQPTTLSSMLDALQSSGVPVGSDLEASMTAFVAQMLEHDLVRPAENAGRPGTPVSFDPAILAQPPTLEVFTDLAELILMDPVHEVDVLEGWPRRPGELRAKD